MTSTRSPRRRASRVLAAPFAIAAGALLAVAGVASPAAAHDALIGSNPENGSSLEQAPESITLEYSANLIDAGTLVEVSSGDGTVVSTGAPQIIGTEVTQALEPELPAGDYTVEWRVTSSDGHPIDSEGTGDAVAFTVTVGAPVASGTPEASETPEPEMTTQTAPDAEDGAEDDGAIEGSAGNEQTPWIAIVGAIAGIGVMAAAILLITRWLRKRKA